jgi:AraC family transcriptional regulator
MASIAVPFAPKKIADHAVVSTLLRQGTVPVGEGVRLSDWLTPAAPVMVCYPERHLLVLHAGKPVGGISRCDGQVHRRVHMPGDIDLVPAGCEAVWEDDARANVFSVSVPRQVLCDVGRDLDMSCHATRLTPQLFARDPRLEHVAWALRAELEAGEVDASLYAQQLVLALGIQLLRRERDIANALPTPSQRLSPQQLQRVVAHIEEGLGSELQLTDLAGVAGLSVSHFATLFRRSTGCSVHNYVMQRRVERARQLLVRGDMSVCEVALETGFSHQSHMARWMRRLLGIAPAALQREAGLAQAANDASARPAGASRRELATA